MSAHDAYRAALDDPLIVAHIDLVRRTGARSVQVRYSDDVQPVVWMAVAEYNGAGTGQGHEVAAAMTPMDALGRLVDQLVDGSKCAHCSRPAGVWRDWQDDPPAMDTFCWTVYDPETQRFRRSCEGEAKIGRNDPCPCGSGQKFKRCHGAAPL